MVLVCVARYCTILLRKVVKPLGRNGSQLRKSENACPATSSGNVAPRTRCVCFGDAFGDEDRQTIEMPAGNKLVLGLSKPRLSGGLDFRALNGFLAQDCLAGSELAFHISCELLTVAFHNFLSLCSFAIAQKICRFCWKCASFALGIR